MPPEGATAVLMDRTCQLNSPLSLKAEPPWTETVYFGESQDRGKKFLTLLTLFPFKPGKFK